MKKLVIIITIIGFSLTLLGIIKQVDTRAVKIENIEIAQSRTLEIGQETKIDIKITPNGASNKKIIWKSSNPDIVDIDEDGNVFAYSDGKATITVSSEDGSIVSTCVITVKKHKDNKDNKDNNADKTTNDKEDTEGINNKQEKDKSSESSKSSNKNENTKNIKQVNSVTLNHKSVTVVNGMTVSLKAAVSPSDAENKNVTWTSSNTSVATVSSTGVITAKSVGTATITVTTEDGSKKATCEVTVTPIRVSGVTLSSSTISMVNGNISTLTATVSPSNAANKNVTWTSSNTSVATVSSSGVVTAKSVGTTTITVTTEDGSKKATCLVTVTPIKVSGVTLNSSTISIVNGNNMILTATVSPSNAANKNVSWTSSNTSVATVSSTGVVTAKSVGTATITVTTEDGNKKATTNITVKPLPIVYFVAHQDDETISASGSILEDLKSGSNVDVHVYLCTDGAGSGVYTQIINGQTKITGKNASNFTRADFSEARDKEYIAALQKLGVNKNNIHILKYTNNSGTLTRFEDGKLKDNKSKLKTVLNDEIKKYTNPAIRAHIPLLTQILSISKSEGKNHYHKDHVTIGNVIYELYSSNTALINMSENDIHNLRFFTDENWTDSDYETTEFKSRYKKYPQTLTSSDKEKWNNARNEYERFEPDNGRYSIGGLSVESQFVSVKNRMDNKGYLNHYFTIGTLYKNNLVTTSTDY